MKMRYLDTHAHLFSEEFADDFDQVVERARQAGVERIVLICCRPEEARKGIAFAARDPQHFQAAVGIHPEDVDHFDEAGIEEMDALIQDPGVSFIGEIGIDYHWTRETKDKQHLLFAHQLELARKTGKPVLIHSRDAAQETFDLLQKAHVPGVMHCYSGSLEMAREYIKLGFFIAFGGALTFKNSKKAQAIVTALDGNWLLTETDCPYMTPEPYRGRRNEPCYIPYIVAKMAELRGVPEEEMAAQIWQNGQRFLGPTA